MKYQYLLLCLFIPLCSHAQYGLNSPEQYTVAFNRETKLKPILSGIADEAPGSVKKRKGAAFMIVGGVLVSSGMILFSQSDKSVSIYLNEDKGNGTHGASDLKAEGGILLAVAGVGMFVPGVIMYSKGKNQLKAYETDKTVSLHLQGAGLALCLKL